MDRCRLLVEGQTEETFANRTLVPHLYDLGFQVVSVTVVATKRIAGGGKHRGGVVSWQQLRGDIDLLAGDHGALVTTLVDFYGLPHNVPGIGELEPQWDARQRVAHIENAMQAEVAASNFVPHVVLHELEALLYSDPAAAGAHFGDDAVKAAMEADLTECGEPELVDEGPETAPSKRMMKHRSGYLKTSDGPNILADIGLAAIRDSCPHFDSWLTTIENFAP